MPVGVPSTGAGGHPRASVTVRSTTYLICPFIPITLWYWFLERKSPTNCDAHMADSIFQTHSSALSSQELDLWAAW